MSLPFEELKAIDIVRFLQSRGVDLKQKGRKFKACCPLPGHDEKEPSFTVSPEHGTWKCFGCGKHGDAVDFEALVKGMDNVAAAKAVADWAGVKLPDHAPVDPKAAEEARKKREFIASLYACLAAAAEYYAKALKAEDAPHPGPARARRYIEERGLSSAIDSFGLGYAPGTDGLIKWLEGKGFARKIRLSAGLTYERDGKELQYFRDRLVIPIEDAGGRVVSFTARTLDPEAEPFGMVQPKYLNGPTTPIFKKSEILFALSKAQRDIRETGRAVIVEGHMDAIALHLTGYFTNSVACQGTAFTVEHAKALVAAGCTDAVIVPDGDGKMPLDKVLDVCLEAALPVRYVKLPSNQKLADGKVKKWDPDAVLKLGAGAEDWLYPEKEGDPVKDGLTWLDDAVNNGPDLALYLIQGVAKATAVGRTQVSALRDQVQPILARLDSAGREWLIPGIANAFGVKEKVVREACGLAFPSKKKISSRTLSRLLSRLYLWKRKGRAAARRLIFNKMQIFRFPRTCFARMWATPAALRTTLGKTFSTAKRKKSGLCGQGKIGRKTIVTASSARPWIYICTFSGRPSIRRPRPAKSFCGNGRRRPSAATSLTGQFRRRGLCCPWTEANGMFTGICFASETELLISKPGSLCPTTAALKCG